MALLPLPTCGYETLDAAIAAAKHLGDNNRQSVIVAQSRLTGLFFLCWTLPLFGVRVGNYYPANYTRPGYWPDEDYNARPGGQVSMDLTMDLTIPVPRADGVAGFGYELLDEAIAAAQRYSNHTETSCIVAFSSGTGLYFLCNTLPLYAVRVGNYYPATYTRPGYWRNPDCEIPERIVRRFALRPFRNDTAAINWASKHVAGNAFSCRVEPTFLGSFVDASPRQETFFAGNGWERVA